jgi:DNA-binding CsgD family transcriptional regulator/PAS domain-containing protein
MTAEADEVSRLIASIYDTTLDPGRWTATLEQIVEFVGGKGAMLGLHDNTRMEGNASYIFGDDPDLTRHYYTNLIQTNPLTVPISLYCAPGEVFSVSGLVRYDEFRNTRVFKEYFAPQGWGDLTHFVIEKSARSFSHFGTAQEGGPASEDVRRRLRLLAPHICRAVAISKMLELRRIEADTFIAILESLTAGVFMVRGRGVIVHANPAGCAMLDDGTVVIVSDGVLTAPHTPSVLRTALAAAAESDGALGGQPATISLTPAGDARWMAHVVPLTTGARRDAGRQVGAETAVFVYRAELLHPTLIETATRHFDLTAGEARVLFALMEAGGIPQVAAALGISEDTVKTHLRRLYVKTGTKRQADLVKSVAAFANPMLS